MKKLSFIVLLGATAASIVYAESTQELLQNVEKTRAKVAASHARVIELYKEHDEKKSSLVSKYSAFMALLRLFGQEHVLTPEDIALAEELTQELAPHIPHNNIEKKDKFALSTVPGLLSSGCSVGVVSFTKQYIEAKGATQRGIDEGLHNTDIEMNRNPDEKVVNECRTLHTFFQTLTANQ